MSLDSFYELGRRSLVINKSEETTLVWHNSTLTLRSEKGMHFINISHNLECLDKNIDFIETYVANPANSPASGLFPAEFMKNGMSNVEYTEMIINPALWAHNSQMIQDLANVSVFEWSPIDFIQHDQCALAVLSNIGSVELYGQIRDKWVNIFSFSKHMGQLLEENMTSPENLYTLKQTVYTVHTSAICWAPVVINKNSCYLVTAQKNGDILFWHLETKNTDVNATLKGCIKDVNCEISTMLWVSLKCNSFLLICSNLFGQILVFNCKIEEQIILHMSSYTLWNHKDRMIAKCLQYVTIDDNIVLICYKHRHLFIQMLDEKCNILSHYINNINDTRITSITVTKEGIFVTTINFKIYKVIVEVINAELIVNIYQIETREPFNDYELSSIGFSVNNVICAIGTTMRKALCRKEPVAIEVVLMTSDRKMNNIIGLLLNNPSKMLTNHWDCIELLRYKTMKTGRMPLIDYCKLYTESENDIYKLKLYLIFLTMYSTLKKSVRIGTEIFFPENSIDIIKETLLFRHAIQLLNVLKSNISESLNNFETESYHGCKKFVEYYCKKYGKNIANMSNILNRNIGSIPTYICQCCDKRLDGFSCEDGHLNMFCSLTLTPIEGVEGYLICKSCGLTAREELFPEKPMCLICDLYFCVS